MNIALLKELCETGGVPGHEHRVRQVVLREVTPLVDDVEVDHMGNVFATKKSQDPKAPTVQLASHMDEIGFIVTHIDDRGFLRFHTLGGFDAKTLTAQRVVVHGRQDLIGVMGTKAVHVMTPEERNKVPKTTDYFIDLGLPKEQVQKLVRVGDTVSRERELIEMGNNLNCKSLDNRIAVFILIEALRNLGTVPFNVVGTFTVQEEVGLRGANVAAHRINPDFGIGIDTTVCYDTPGAAAHERVTSMGEGVAVKIMDSGTICDVRMVDFLRKTAEKQDIKHQHEILTAGGTDTAGLQRMGKQGAIAGAVSIPTRYLHQVIEMVSKTDVQACIDLLVAALGSMDQYDWAHPTDLP